MSDLHSRTRAADASWIDLRLAVGLVAAAALLLRLHGLGALPLWLDEAYSAWFSSRDWSYLWSDVPQFETHPSFYYSLLKLWRAFGDDEATLRLLSVVLNVATIPLIAVTARLCGDRHAGRPASLVAAILFACSATQLHAAQEARPYALMTFAMALALACSVAVMTAGARAHEPMRRMLMRDRPMVLAFVGIGAGLALLAWSHNFGPVFGLILAACLVGYWVSVGTPQTLFVNFLISAGVAAVLYAPNIPIILMQTQAIDSQGFWLSPPGANTIVRAAVAMPLGLSPYQGAPIAGLAALSVLTTLIGFAGLFRQAVRPPLAVPATLVVMGIVPALVSFLISHLGQPVFLFRTLQASQVPVMVCLAFAPFAFGSPARWGILALLTLLAACALWSFQTGKRPSAGEAWPEIVRTIVSRSEAKVPTVLVYPPEAELPLLYYTDRLGLELDIRTVPGPYPARGSEYAYPAGGGGSPGMTPAIRDQAMSILAQEAEAWFVTRRLDIYDPTGLLMSAVARDFPCLIDDTISRIELRRRAGPGCS